MRVPKIRFFCQFIKGEFAKNYFLNKKWTLTYVSHNATNELSERDQIQFLPSFQNYRQCLKNINTQIRTEVLKKTSTKRGTQTSRPRGARLPPRPPSSVICASSESSRKIFARMQVRRLARSTRRLDPYTEKIRCAKLQTKGRHHERVGVVGRRRFFAQARECQLSRLSLLLLLLGSKATESDRELQMHLRLWPGLCRLALAKVLPDVRDPKKEVLKIQKYCSERSSTKLGYLISIELTSHMTQVTWPSQVKILSRVLPKAQKCFVRFNITKYVSCSKANQVYCSFLCCN